MNHQVLDPRPELLPVDGCTFRTFLGNRFHLTANPMLAVADDEGLETHTIFDDVFLNDTSPINNTLLIADWRPFEKSLVFEAFNATMYFKIDTAQILVQGIDKLEVDRLVQ